MSEPTAPGQPMTAERLTEIRNRLDGEGGFTPDELDFASDAFELLDYVDYLLVAKAGLLDYVDYLLITLKGIQNGIDAVRRLERNGNS